MEAEVVASHVAAANNNINRNNSNCVAAAAAVDNIASLLPPTRVAAALAVLAGAAQRSGQPDRHRVDRQGNGVQTHRTRGGITYSILPYFTYI